MSCPRDVDAIGTHHVYRIFALDGTLLYIGVTDDVEHRIYMHLQTTTNRDWVIIWAWYGRHDSVEYPDRLTARAAERRLIEDEAPLLNRQHNPKRWRKNFRKSYEPLGDTAAEMARKMEHPEGGWGKWRDAS